MEEEEEEEDKYEEDGGGRERGRLGGKKVLREECSQYMEGLIARERGTEKGSEQEAKVSREKRGKERKKNCHGREGG